MEHHCLHKRKSVSLYQCHNCFTLRRAPRVNWKLCRKIYIRPLSEVKADA